MNKIHVAHIVESFAAGCLTSIATLCHILQDDFHFSIIHSLRPESPANYKDLFPAGVNFYYLPEMENRINPVKNLKAYRSLKDSIKKISPDVAHCHSAIAGFLGRIVAYSQNLPVIYSPRGYSFLRVNTSPLNKAACAALEWVAAKGNGVTVACGKQEFDLAAKLGSKEKSLFIPNALDLEYIDACASSAISEESHDRVMVGTCGRLSVARNFEFFSKVASLVSNADWVWLGAEKDSQELPETVRRSDWLGREEALKEMAKLDIYVHTSAWDGLSNTLLEAMALGKPVVATDIPANRAVIEEGVTGFLCSDEKQMVARIQTLLADPELRNRMGQAARKYVEDVHDAKKIYPLFGALYNRLAGVTSAAA